MAREHSPERLPGESFEQYKHRRALLNAIRRAQRNRINRERFEQVGNPRRKLYPRTKTEGAPRKQHKHPQHDENGAFTLVGRNPRRIWVAGISARAAQ